MIDPKSSNGTLLRRAEARTYIHWGEGHMQIEAEIGIMLPKAKEYLGLPKLEKARRDTLLEPSRGTWSCWHLDFRLLASGTVREQISVCFKLPGLQSFVKKTQEMSISVIPLTSPKSKPHLNQSLQTSFFTRLILLTLYPSPPSPCHLAQTLNLRTLQILIPASDRCQPQTQVARPSCLPLFLLSLARETKTYDSFSPKSSYC